MLALVRREYRFSCNMVRRSSDLSLVTGGGRQSRSCVDRRDMIEQIIMPDLCSGNLSSACQRQLTQSAWHDCANGRGQAGQSRLRQRG
jgi:hypothetical protein